MPLNSTLTHLYQAQALPNALPLWQLAATILVQTRSASFQVSSPLAQVKAAAVQVGDRK